MAKEKFDNGLSVFNKGKLSRPRSFFTDGVDALSATDTIGLSKESMFKVTSFFSRFCTHGDIGHLIFAFHAAFPMILSARLANILWLNFKEYRVGGHRKNIDLVAVSDLLLSPLVRPIGHGQVEFIPEIRLYFLSILASKARLLQFSIDPFEENRLSRLSKFLLHYFSSGPVLEHDAIRFKMVNEWTAYSYENPEELALKVRDEFAKTFSEKVERDENAQLALNMLMNRFSSQLKLKINKAGKDTWPIFDSLYQYSGANRNVAFGEDLSKISDSFAGLTDRFVSLKNAQGALPIVTDAPVLERLSLKKRKIRRVIPVLDSNLQSGEVEEFLSVVNGLKHFQVEYQQRLIEVRIRVRVFFDAFQLAINRANPEDVILLILSRDFLIRNNQSNNGSDWKEFIATFKSIRGNSSAQIVLMHPSALNTDEFLLAEGDIQISGNTIRGFEKANNTNETLFFKVLRRLVSSSLGKLNYKELVLAMNELIRWEGVDGYKLSLKSGEDGKNTQFLTRKIIHSRGYQPLMAFNNVNDRWQVIAEELMMNRPFLRYEIHDFFNNKVVAQGRSQSIINDELKFSTVTEFLKDSLYRISPLSQILPIILEIEDEKLREEIVKVIVNVGVDESSPALFSVFETVDDALGYNSAVRIAMLENRSDPLFEVSYILPSSGKGRHEYFKRVTSEIKEIKGWLKIVRSFDYFISLGNDNEQGGKFSFDQFHFSASMGNEYDLSSQQSSGVLVGSDFFDVVNGQFTLKPLNIFAEFNSDKQIYFDLYIAWSDMQIEPLKLQEPIGGNISVFEMRVDMENYYDEVIIRGRSFFVKFILSEFLVETNFHQDAINIKSYWRDFSAKDSL